MPAARFVGVVVPVCGGGCGGEPPTSFARYAREARLRAFRRPAPPRRVTTGTDVPRGPVPRFTRATKGVNVASSVEPKDTAQTKERLEQALFEIRRVIAGPGSDARTGADLPA